VYNVTFTYVGPTVDNTAGNKDLFLGDFFVLTGELPTPPLNPLNYGALSTGPTGGPVVNYGVTDPQLVPEPAGWVLAATGAPALLFLLRWRRRSR
jgi:hypothetical protein